MHKLMLKIFEFLKNCIQFIKILIIFGIMMLILYWIQNLTGIFWNWTKFATPFLDFLLDIGKTVMSGSINLFAAVFEFKFFIALLIFILFYAVAHFSVIALESLENIYGEGRRVVKKIEEDMFNKKMEERTNFEQKKLKRYQVFISTTVKPKYAHKEYNIDMAEQNQILVKHLIAKTGICPTKFEDGFLFTFESFGEIDNILDIFSKLFESKAPVDYIVCVQILGTDSQREKDQLKTLINLKMINKITAFADTSYRYEFNTICRYETSQVGVFQKEDKTFEVHEFIRKD